MCFFGSIEEDLLQEVKGKEGQRVEKINLAHHHLKEKKKKEEFLINGNLAPIIRDNREMRNVIAARHERHQPTELIDRNLPISSYDRRRQTDR